VVSDGCTCGSHEVLISLREPHTRGHAGHQGKFGTTARRAALATSSRASTRAVCAHTQVIITIA